MQASLLFTVRHLEKTSSTLLRLYFNKTKKTHTLSVSPEAVGALTANIYRRNLSGLFGLCCVSVVLPASSHEKDEAATETTRRLSACLSVWMAEEDKRGAEGRGSKQEIVRIAICHISADKVNSWEKTSCVNVARKTLLSYFQAHKPQVLTWMRPCGRS